MERVGGLEAAARNAFFLYTLPERRGEPIAQKMVLDDFRMREEALQEVNDLLLLLNNREEDPRYKSAFAFWAYRMRSIGDSNILKTREGIEGYLDFLVRVTNPLAREIKAAYFRG